MNGLQEPIRGMEQIPPHILIMEDEINVAKGLEMILSEEGYAVDLALSGHNALQSFTDKRFDLLVADLRLPDIDGMEVIKQVREKHPQTAVVVITGYASVSSAVEAMRLGTFDYLPKPFTDDEILSTIDGALKGKKAVPSEEVLQKVEKDEEKKLIQKQEVIRVLERTARDDKFWKALLEVGSDALKGYQLTSEAKAAIISGDVTWIKKNAGDLSGDYLVFVFKRLEREAW